MHMHSCIRKAYASWPLTRDGREKSPGPSYPVGHLGPGVTRGHGNPWGSRGFWDFTSDSAGPLLDHVIFFVALRRQMPGADAVQLRLSRSLFPSARIISLARSLPPRAHDTLEISPEGISQIGSGIPSSRDLPPTLLNTLSHTIFFLISNTCTSFQIYIPQTIF